MLMSFWSGLPRLLRIVLSRLAVLVPQMFCVLLVTFFLVRLLPGDPALLLLGNTATETTIAALRERLGLDLPIWSQFWIYMGNVLQGDLGTSILTSQPVTQDLVARAPATLELIFYSLLLSVLLGVSVAIVSVIRPRGIVDRISQVYAFAAGAIPDFLVGLLLIFVLFFLLGIAAPPFGRIDLMVAPPTPITGFYTVDALLTGNLQAFASAAGRLALPVLTLTIVTTGAIMKMARSTFQRVWVSPFIQHQRACGLPEGRIMRNALKNALPPIITTVGFFCGFLLGAAVLVETVFSWGGLGQYAVQAVINSDYSALQGFVLFASVFILLIYLVVDILYEVVDPRIEV